jgi:hypothetical protein
MDSRLKTALLDIAALKRETPGKIITRALAHYLKRRRAESQRPEAPSVRRAERILSQTKKHTTNEQ